jgi:hypothetical protein
MTIIAASKSRNARLVRQSAIGHGGAHSNVQRQPQCARPQWFNAADFTHSSPLTSRNAVQQCLLSRSRTADASSAALKSP